MAYNHRELHHTQILLEYGFTITNNYSYHFRLLITRNKPVRCTDLIKIRI
jgi:hypothetical protein